MTLGRETKKEKITRLEEELRIARAEVAKLKVELGLCKLNSNQSSPVNPWCPQEYPRKPGISPYDYPSTMPIIWC